MTELGRIFCFGLGYSALALAERLLSRGWRVAGTCTTEDKKRAIESLGIEAFVFNDAQKLTDPRGALAGATHILASVPPDPRDPVLAAHGSDIAAMKGVQWIGYLSTTGVYGDRAGGWVDESSELKPSGRRSVDRAAAEAAWLDLWRAHRLPVHSFRLAGIYGPGRGTVEMVKRGQARRIVKPGQIFSRIHVEDIAGVLLASMARPNPGAVYNVCDDDPAPNEKVVEEACRLLGIVPPPAIPFDEARKTMSDMQLSFYADSKRVRNDRLKKELGYELKYPSYKDGLRAILQPGDRR